MPRLKLTNPGFENMTGVLHDIEFRVGWSAPLAPATIRRIGNVINADVYDDEGTTLLYPAGSAHWMTTERGPDERPELPAGVEDDAGSEGGTEPEDEGGEDPETEPDP